MAPRGRILPMARRTSKLAKWAAGGAIIAAILSVLSLLLPAGLGGYNAWNDAHLVIHNLAAILTRIVVFALVGAALAGAWHHNRRPSH